MSICFFLCMFSPYCQCLLVNTRSEWTVCCCWQLVPSGMRLLDWLNVRCSGLGQLTRQLMIAQNRVSMVTHAAEAGRSTNNFGDHFIWCAAHLPSSLQPWSEALAKHISCSCLCAHVYKCICLTKVLMTIQTNIIYYMYVESWFQTPTAVMGNMQRYNALKVMCSCDLITFFK